MTLRHSKFGFLCGVGGNRNGIGTHFERLDAAGLPITIGSYDDYGVIDQVARLRIASGVPHNLIFRPNLQPFQNPNYMADPIAAAEQRWNYVKTRIPPEFNKQLVWLVVDNEGQDHQDADGPLADRTVYEWAGWWGAYNVALAHYALADGYRLLVNGWSAGTPHHDFWSHPANITFLRLCDEFPNQVGIAVHEGAAPNDPLAPYGNVINSVGWISGRYRRAFAVCDQYQLNRPRIFITEFAFKFDDVPGVSHFLSQIEIADRFYAADPEVGGICLWFLGSGHANIANKLAGMIPGLTSKQLDTTIYDRRAPLWPDGGPHPGTEPQPPMSQYRKLIHLLPQDATRDELNHVAAVAYPERNTIAFSADDTRNLLMLPDSAPDSRVVIWDALRAERWPRGDIQQFFEDTGMWIEARPLPGCTPPPITTPNSTAIWGIDVSHHQDPHKIDWQRLKADGCTFVIIRGGYGTELDSRAYAHHQYATQHGLLRMPYWFVDGRWSGIDQGITFARFVNSFDWDGIAWFDVEVTTLPGYGPVTPSLEQVISAYRGYFGLATLPAGNYTNKYSWDTIMQGYDPVESGCTPLLWLADWQAPDAHVSPAKIPAPFSAAFLIQETARNMPAYAGQLDINFFNGTLAELTAPATWPAAASVAFGIHASADAYNMTGDTDLLRTAGFDAIKYLSSHRPEDILRCEQHIDGPRRLIRAFLSIDGTPLSPQAFCDRTLPDVLRTIAMLGPDTDIWLELHNEPNLHDEGMFRLWPTADAFAAWIGQVARLYRQQLPPGVKLAFPGVAPVAAIPNVAVSGDAMLRACVEVIDNEFDALCLHTYWGAIGDTLYDAVATVRRWAAEFPQHDIWISEASHKGQASPGEKATQYLEYVQQLQAIPNVVGVTFFVLSASNPAWGWESGSGETWRPSMAATVGE